MGTELSHGFFTGILMFQAEVYDARILWRFLNGLYQKGEEEILIRFNVSCTVVI
jgi:hypothetical protein